MLPPLPAKRRSLSALLQGALALVALLVVAAAIYVLAPARTVAIEYSERVTGNASPGDTLPLLVALHGRGSSPAEFARAFEELDVPARIVFPRAPDRLDVGRSWYPLGNPLRRHTVIRNRTEQLASLIRRIAHVRPTRGRPVVTGFSQGGVMSFALAASYPEDFAAAFPVAATRYPGMARPEPSAHPPEFHAIHGHDDPIMPFADARAMVAAMRTAGGNASLTGHDAVGHALSDAMRVELLHNVRRALAKAQRAARNTRPVVLAAARP